jgi:hypothetical protein
MAEKNRASALAIVEEVTAGTYVAPTVGSQFIALQEGFSFSPNFQVLDNEEIRSSIGRSKSIQGLESPEGSFSHYLRHSGVEGTAPGFGPLLEAVIGSTSSNATERSTDVGSTVSVVNLAAGGGDFARGKAILLKDGTNGYSIRPVDSVATNALTLGFDLSAAPASGIGAGKCVNYTPVDTGHPSLSMTLYRGNGGAIEAIAGSRLTEMAISVQAGELINASFSFAGTKYFFNPIEITSTTDSLDFTNDNGTFVATIPSQTYRDPHELAQAVSDAMNSADPLETHTCVYIDATGRFRISCTGTVLSLLWNTGANNAQDIGGKLGFSTAADDTGVAATTGYTSDNAIVLSNVITPAYDSADPQAAKNNEVFIGDSDDITCFCASTMDLTVSNEVQDVECVCAESGVQDKVYNSRSVEAVIVGILERYDADKFRKYRANSTVKFLYNFGSKSGGNWVAGQCASVYIPSASISAFELGDNNGLVTMNITISAFVDSSGNGEFYLNFL